MALYSAALLLVVLTHGQVEVPIETLNRIDVLPRNWSSSFDNSPEEQRLMLELIEMPREQRERLLSSDDSRDRGIGLFVTSEQGDLKCLLELHDWLADKRPTIPDAGLNKAITPPGERSFELKGRTLGWYVCGEYFMWFGVYVSTPGEFALSPLSRIENPDLLVRPWLVRLNRIRNIAHLETTTDKTRDKMTAGVNEIKSRIAALPEEIRWAVVMEAHWAAQTREPDGWDQYYSEKEAREILRSLSDPLREKIRSGTADLKFEPNYWDYDRGEYKERAPKLMQAAARLLEEPQQ